MDTARIYVTTLCLAAIVSVPVPGFSASPNAAPQASADQAKGDGCDKGGQEPSPRAERESKRQNAEPKAKDCSRSQGQASESNAPTNEESDMKSNEGGFVAALLLAMAASSAHGAQASIAIGGCHTTSPQAPIAGPAIPEGYFFCGTVAGQPVCSPEIKVDGVPGGGTADEYCSQLTSSGSGAMVVKEKVGCPEGKTGVIIERSGASTFSLTFKKNGVSVLPLAIEQNSPPNTLTVADLCFIAPPGL